MGWDWRTQRHHLRQLQIPQPLIQDPAASLPPHPSSCRRWDCTRNRFDLWDRWFHLIFGFHLPSISQYERERERERERESFWQNERESWTDFLKKKFFYFFLFFIIINNFFLYNNMWPKMVRWIYDLGAWRGF